jgi:signal transduction protein with GAF and PtsI domain
MSADANIVTKPPKLMRAIRNAMAGTESVQERLDDFVAAIQSAMKVKVASIYLLRPGAELELRDARVETIGRSHHAHETGRRSGGACCPDRAAPKSC